MSTKQRILRLLKSVLDTVGAWATADRRRTVIAGCGVLAFIALGLGLALGLEVATLTVVVYGTVFAGVSMLGVTPLRALPALQVGFWVDGELVPSFTRQSDRPRAPIDIDGCMRNALSAIRAEIPSPPPPPSPLTLAVSLGNIGGLSGIGGLESRDEAVARLEIEIEEYAIQQRQWLAAFESRRRASYSLISLALAIHNGGESAADGIILRLHMPNGIVPMTVERLEKLDIDPPPQPPRYKQRSVLDFGDQLVLPARHALMPDLSGLISNSRAGVAPVWTREQRHHVAEVRLPTLTHGVTELTVAPLEVLPREPGTYEIAWEAHVENLRRPARGTIRLAVEPMPEGGEPLTYVEQVMNSGDVEVTDTVDYRP